MTKCIWAWATAIYYRPRPPPPADSSSRRECTRTPEADGVTSPHPTPPPPALGNREVGGPVGEGHSAGARTLFLLPLSIPINTEMTVAFLKEVLPRQPPPPGPHLPEAGRDPQA